MKSEDTKIKLKADIWSYIIAQRAVVAELRKDLESAADELSSAEVFHKKLSSDATATTDEVNGKEPEPTHETTPSGTDPAAEQAVYGMNLKAIRASFDQIPAVFNIDDVENALRERRYILKRDQIGQTLSKMGRLGQLEIADPSAGRRPAKYRNPLFGKPTE